MHVPASFIVFHWHSMLARESSLESMEHVTWSCSVAFKMQLTSGSFASPQQYEPASPAEGFTLACYQFFQSEPFLQHSFDHTALLIIPQRSFAFTGGSPCFLDRAVVFVVELPSTRVFPSLSRSRLHRFILERDHPFNNRQLRYHARSVNPNWTMMSCTQHEWRQRRMR